MTLQALEKKIKNAVRKDGSLSFSGDLIDSSTIGELLSSCFQDGIIDITSASTFIENKNSVLVRGQVNYQKLECTIRIVLTISSENQVEMVAEVELEDGWNMPELFPNLIDPILKRLIINKAKLVINSQTNYEDPTYQVPLEQGLSLVGTLLVGKSLDGLAPFWGDGEQLTIFGNIANKDIPLMKLGTKSVKASLGTLTFGDVRLELAINNIGSVENIIAHAQHGLLGTIEVGGQDIVNWQASIAAASCPINLSAKFDSITLSDLRELAPFIGDTELLGALPEDIKSEVEKFSNKFSIKGLSLVIDPQNESNHIRRASVLLSVNLNNYQIFGAIPSLSIEELDFLFNVSHGEKSKVVTFEASTKIRIRNGYDVWLGFQTQPGGSYIISVVQDSNSELKLTQALEPFLPDLPDLPNLYVENFSVRIDPVIGNYACSADIKTDWEIISQPSIQLKEITLSAQYNEASSRSVGALLGIFTMVVDENQPEKNIDLLCKVEKTDSGWDFSSYTGYDQLIPIGDLVQSLAAKFGAPNEIPPAVKDLTLSNLNLDFSTSENDDTQFSFSAKAEDTICGQEVYLVLKIDTSKAEGQYSNTFSADLLIGSAIFSGKLNTGTDTAIELSWTAKDGHTLSFQDITQAFDFTLPDIPEELDLALKSALLSYDFTNKTLVIEAESANYGDAVLVAYEDPNTKKREYYFGLDIGKTINLSNLPLIDQVLAGKETLAVEGIQVLISSAPLDPANNPAAQKDIGLINCNIGDGYPKIPTQGLPSDFSISTVLDFGGKKIPMSVGAPASNNPADNASQHSLMAAPVSGGTGNGTAPSPAADGAVWLNVQKSFGPINFQKVGVQYKEGTLWFLLDAALMAGGLEISVIGLSAGSPLSTFEPEFNIEGLGISYSNPTLTISGSFEKLPPKSPVTLEFAGTATLQAEEFGITAVGAYAQFNGQTSMFVFANIDTPLGGPGCFFVTGLCGGFGYNSQLRIPGQDEVFQFPFVNSFADPSALGQDTSPTGVLETIMGGDKPWVTPSAGDIWLAAGLEFTTYEIVNSTALLIAEFGSKFELALIGLSKARFPMEGSVTYAYVELQLESIFDPSEGAVSFTAVLSPNSYILDPNCHLTGGFAMCFWYEPSPYAGDFVVTLGGYSPYFTPPAHYPQEPRVGFNWAPDSSISIRGGVYFALTPSAIMAGGDLNASYHSGNLKAWFDAYTDIIIWYNPFHFIADIGISIGASYKLHLLFCSKTVTAELGADLALWGPETGGTAHIHWWVISFTVNFGAGQSSGLEKQAWSDFVKVLPAPENALKIIPKAGLSSGQVPAAQPQALQAKSGDVAAPWIVRADSFEFTTQSTIPLTKLYVEGEQEPSKKGSPLNIKPMEATGLTSQNHLSINSKGASVLDDSWEIDFVTSNVPSALWGTGSNTALSNEPQLVSDQLAGFRIKVPAPVLGQGTGDISIKDNLQYDPLKSGTCPLQLDPAAQGLVPTASQGTIAEIEQIMSSSVEAQRGNTYTALATLGMEDLQNGDLTNLANNAGALFSDEPLLIAS
ncbi:MAG: DUF6603 domain-containing protein [Bacteroidota bacterium]